MLFKTAAQDATYMGHGRGRESKTNFKIYPVLLRLIYAQARWLLSTSLCKEPAPRPSIRTNEICIKTNQGSVFREGWAPGLGLQPPPWEQIIRQRGTKVKTPPLTIIPPRSCISFQHLHRREGRQLKINNRVAGAAFYRDRHSHPPLPHIFYTWPSILRPGDLGMATPGSQAGHWPHQTLTQSKSIFKPELRAAELWWTRHTAPHWWRTVSLINWAHLSNIFIR